MDTVFDIVFHKDFSLIEFEHKILEVLLYGLLYNYNLRNSVIITESIYATYSQFEVHRQAFVDQPLADHTKVFRSLLDYL